MIYISDFYSGTLATYQSDSFPSFDWQESALQRAIADGWVRTPGQYIVAKPEYGCLNCKVLTAVEGGLRVAS